MTYVLIQVPPGLNSDFKSWLKSRLFIFSLYFYEVFHRLIDSFIRRRKKKKKRCLGSLQSSSSAHPHGLADVGASPVAVQDIT